MVVITLYQYISERLAESNWFVMDENVGAGWELGVLITYCLVVSYLVALLKGCKIEVFVISTRASLTFYKLIVNFLFSPFSL